MFFRGEPWSKLKTSSTRILILKPELFEIRRTQMYAYYTRVFAIGKSTHRVEVYENYTEERGLIGEPIISRNDGSMYRCLLGLPITPEQKEIVAQAGRDRQDMIVHPDGKRTCL